LTQTTTTSPEYASLHIFIISIRSSVPSNQTSVTDKDGPTTPLKASDEQGSASISIVEALAIMYIAHKKKSTIKRIYLIVEYQTI
jgi:hypothetical protein